MARAKLSDILDGMECQGDEMRVFLDKQTGRTLMLTDDDLHADGPDEDAPARPQWEQALIEQAKALQADDGSRFQQLPDRFDIDEWRMMRDFAVRAGSEDRADALLDAVHGSEAFRRFKDCVHRFGIAEAWYAFRQERYRRVALDWCEVHGVEVDPDA